MIAPDDERHGTRNGYRLGCRDQCCRKPMAESMAERRRRLYLGRRDRLSVPAITVHRRIQALVALGWSLSEVSRLCGYHRSHLALMLTRTSPLHLATAERIEKVYAELSMTLPPESTRAERINASRARRIASDRGWAVPLAWDNIDDPDERPHGHRTRHADRDYDSAHIIDEATILRILAGETLPANKAERFEVMRRWLAMGNSEASLCKRTGWKDSRYVTRAEGAA